MLAPKLDELYLSDVIRTINKDSSITVMRIPTDEEYMICCDVEALMNE